jgi:hypothetical protein
MELVPLKKNNDAGHEQSMHGVHSMTAQSEKISHHEHVPDEHNHPATHTTQG